MTARPDVPALGATDFKSEYRPVWCPGCGHYAVLSSLIKALPEVGVRREDVAIVSGIGCSSRLPAYTSVYGFHGVHGRALPIAIGLKVARPDLTVIAAGGDGDGYSIGGNHFLHACRRNVDMTYLVMDNQVYGMTKGQASPTTPSDWTKSKLTPHGTGVSPFHPLAVALAAGANFIARCYAGDPNGTARVITEAIRHPGFAMVQVLSQCVTYQPSQREWKDTVRKADITPTSQADLAARWLMADDGLSTGVMYVGQRPVYRPDLTTSLGIEELERPFVV